MPALKLLVKDINQQSIKILYLTQYIHTVEKQLLKKEFKT